MNLMLLSQSFSSLQVTSRTRTSGWAIRSNGSAGVGKAPCELRQRNAALVAIDGFDALFEAVIPGVAEGNLFEGRELPGGASIGCVTLESVRAAKVASGREKDVLDVAEIDRMGCDPARYARVAAAYAAIRIDCVAHGE